jgi:hypothetical protein
VLCLFVPQHERDLPPSVRLTPQQIARLAQHLPCGRIKPLFHTPIASSNTDEIDSTADDTTSVHSDIHSVDGSSSDRSSSSNAVAVAATAGDAVGVNAGWTGRDVCDGDVCTIIASATGSQQVITNKCGTYTYTSAAFVVSLHMLYAWKVYAQTLRHATEDFHINTASRFTT